MIIKKASFYASMKEKSSYPQGDLPEIAIAGKSNVGKSSLINYLAGNSRLAYVSKQPGKTRLINFFVMNQEFFLVDLPGYGFARVSKSEKQSWSDMMEGYFAVSKNLRLLIILMDIRHDPSAEDIEMINWAMEYHVPFLVVLTKADKIAKSKRYNCIAHMKKVIHAQEDYPMIAVSAKDKLGKDALLELMENFLA